VFVLVQDGNPSDAAHVVQIDVGQASVSRSYNVDTALADDPISVSPNGRTLWFLDSAGLIPLDISTGTTGEPISVGGQPEEMDFAIGARAWVLVRSYGSAAPATQIVPFDLQSDRPGRPIPLPPPLAPSGYTLPSVAVGIELSRDGKVAYVADGADSIWPVNLITRQVGDRIPAIDPVQVAPSGNGRAWVRGDEGLAFVELSGGAIIRFDPTTAATDMALVHRGRTLLAVTTGLEVLSTQYAWCSLLQSILSRSSGSAHRSGAGGSPGSTSKARSPCPTVPSAANRPPASRLPDSNALVVINARTGALERTVALPVRPQSLEVAQGGRTALVVGDDNAGDAAVAFIDLSTFAITDELVVQTPANPLGGLDRVLEFAGLTMLVVPLATPIVYIAVIRRRARRRLNESWQSVGS
jgi:hypothetical protein